MSSTRLNIHHYASSATSHAHAAHSQLVFGLYGSLELEFEGRGASVDSTALAIIAPGDEHTYFSRDGGHCLVLDISPQQQLDGLNLNLAAQQRLLEKTTLHTLTPQQGSLVRRPLQAQAYYWPACCNSQRSPVACQWLRSTLTLILTWLIR